MHSVVGVESPLLHRSAAHAERVANFLQAHPQVSQVNWPFLKSFPQEPLARKQMKRCAGLMSIRVKAADIAGVERFCNGLQRFLLAVSWGGYESLQFPTAAVIGPGMPQGELPWDLVRIYVGLEDPEALIADLEQALALV